MQGQGIDRERSGQHDRQEPQHGHKLVHKEPELFKVALAGCAAIKNPAPAPVVESNGPKFKGETSEPEGRVIKVEDGWVEVETAKGHRYSLRLRDKEPGRVEVYSPNGYQVVPIKGLPLEVVALARVHLGVEK